MHYKLKKDNIKKYLIVMIIGISAYFLIKHAAGERQPSVAKADQSVTFESNDNDNSNDVLFMINNMMLNLVNK